MASRISSAFDAGAIEVVDDADPANLRVQLRADTNRLSSQLSSASARESDSSAPLAALTIAEFGRGRTLRKPETSVSDPPARICACCATRHAPQNLLSIAIFPLLLAFACAATVQGVWARIELSSNATKPSGATAVRDRTRRDE